MTTTENVNGITDQVPAGGVGDERIADLNNEKTEGDTSSSQPKPPKPAPQRKRTPSTGRAKSAKKPAVRKRPQTTKSAAARASSTAKFPRHTIERALRIPRAILDQNAGHPCSTADAAKFLGLTTSSGPFGVEVSSAKKYGFLETKDQKLAVTERAKSILRPQSDSDELSALREAVLSAPDISEVYNHYRGEYLPDDNFFTNALTDRFKVPADRISDFREVFFDSVRKARLLDESGERHKLIDIGREDGAKPPPAISQVGAKKSSGSSGATGTTTCFVMQPFAAPYGGYYEAVFKPAIEQAGLRAVRADAEIFGTGKIMDQVWRGIKAADILLAELTTKNANVYYELGLAHALGKPVVLVASNESDVPFDLRHIRVIYYDMTDPFWGNKLVDKIAENVRSALQNPEEAIFAVDELP